MGWQIITNHIQCSKCNLFFMVAMVSIRLLSPSYRDKATSMETRLAYPPTHTHLPLPSFLCSQPHCQSVSNTVPLCLHAFFHQGAQREVIVSPLGVGLAHSEGGREGGEGGRELLCSCTFHEGLRLSSKPNKVRSVCVCELVTDI